MIGLLYNNYYPGHGGGVIHSRLLTMTITVTQLKSSSKILMLESNFDIPGVTKMTVADYSWLEDIVDWYYVFS